MLGFLTIEEGREDIEGPTLELKNEYRGETFNVHPASRTTMSKAQDPCHSGWCVDEQVANDCGGFVSNFMKTRKTGGANPGVVMAYDPAPSFTATRRSSRRSSPATAGRRTNPSRRWAHGLRRRTTSASS
jgi:hypothetical protein